MPNSSHHSRRFAAYRTFGLVAGALVAVLFLGLSSSALATRPTRAGAPQFTADERISVSGYLLGRVLVVPSNGIHALRSVSRSTASTTVGTINTAVIVATFTDSSNQVNMQTIQNVFHGNPGRDVESY